MSEWDTWAEEQRQRNFQRVQQEQQKKSNQAEAEMIGGAIGVIIGAFFFLVGLAFAILVLCLKYFFLFLVFLRNKFFIHWNWYVKTEDVIYQGLIWIKKIVGIILAIIFILPFVILFKWWELWLVVGIVLLYYYYGK
ncbi:MULTISPECIES: hypothetical protein [Campylobacter]|uniref:Uncharacterized protein n=1 Tax=Campylobacter helveticus TaxID=28898 RepID=A0AAX2UII5_9BACT|nr:MULTISPECIES: hypothetical protein [Campylobacter]EEY3085985.1 hypothetical protein [Campylobacter jejuni]ARE81499.1 hypothetical protein CHELV3228_b0036 [Campylobacter helveticus]EAH5200844.1 hypothetical protein [Campylobacter upsaliensis]EAI4345252.1 hypothetical protein [Campylobacter upsaliensis]EAJ0412374.1 hypothetical protein [Campylobacter upsaliensis]